MKPVQAAISGVSSFVGGLASGVASLLSGGEKKSESTFAAPAPYVHPPLPQMPPATATPVAPPPPTPSFYSSQVASAGTLAQRFTAQNATRKSGPQGDLSTPNRGLKSLLGQ